mmetsp:Transcript_4396/g.28023  ORF Transcript_4396/g.28023 Transcript_4396/m.28023 type:complete len:93 (-) Transcript_4396:2288-2566(-)
MDGINRHRHRPCGTKATDKARPPPSATPGSQGSLLQPKEAVHLATERIETRIAARIPTNVESSSNTLLGRTAAPSVLHERAFSPRLADDVLV